MRVRSWSVLVVAITLSLTVAAQQPDAPATTAPISSVASADQQLQHGDAQAAIATLQALQAQAPNTKGLQHELGLAFYRSGKLIEAEAAFAKAVEQDPNDKESLQLRGLTLYRLGRPAAAIPFLEQVRQWMPNGNADVNYVLGLCYLNSRRYDDARGAFAQQYGLAPASGAAYLLLGNMLLAANLPELALTAGQKALQLTPNLPLAHFMLGEVFLYKSDPAAALNEFSQERTLNPAYAPTYDRLGDAYLRTGQLQQAQESLTRALSLDRSSTGPFIQMGKVFLKKNEFPEAAMYLQHAEKMDPGNYITHTLLGQAYRGMGKANQARQELDIAEKIHAAGELKLETVR